MPLGISGYAPTGHDMFFLYPLLPTCSPYGAMLIFDSPGSWLRSYMPYIGNGNFRININQIKLICPVGAKGW